jgi:hypothetical protein
MARINIRDDDENWVRWGLLVLRWILDKGSRPQDLQSLKLEIESFGVELDGKLDGTDDRKVQIYSYDDNPANPLWLGIPSQKMLEEKLKKIGLPAPDHEMIKRELERLGIKSKIPGMTSGGGSYRIGPYPLPLFYDKAYPCPPDIRFSWQEAWDQALRRIGEYTVNECC